MDVQFEGVIGKKWELLDLVTINRDCVLVIICTGLLLDHKRKWRPTGNLEW